MARAVASDFLHVCRFHVAIANGQEDLLARKAVVDGQTAVAGFTTCTIPELSVETVEYKEGTFLYPRKYAGNPSVSDISMTRGVSRQDSAFWDWAQRSAEGAPAGGTYRVDLNIYHFHRDTVLAGGQIQEFGGQVENAYASAVTYKVNEALAIKCKPASDLDANSSDVAIAELDVALEYFQVVQPA